VLLTVLSAVMECHSVTYSFVSCYGPVIVLLTVLSAVMDLSCATYSWD
jgi:hypothetical protein